ncbi:MAG: VIT1/CCC1 transporter family protein [Actinobacteria bacterium]|nr:VIT1/CCC1 transporter family protein [Actinomycetota bacterium]
MVATSKESGSRRVKGAATRARSSRHRLSATSSARRSHGEHHHRKVQGGAARAAVFGMSDGLVTNVSLILGVAGAHPSGNLVALVGLAGLVAGACSMAAGEFVSMQAQSELLQQELNFERHEISSRPDQELRELQHLYERRGLAPEEARQLASAMMRDPDMALETHAREELGIDPEDLGSPVQAAVSSFATFALGAVIPLVPWLVTSGGAALVASVVAGALSAMAVGAALSVFTGRPWWRSALRQLLWASAAAAITWSVGRAVGISGLS